MDFVQNLMTQLTGLWGRWSRAQQVMVAGGVLGCLLLVGAVGYWSLQPEYVQLASGLTPADAAEIVSTLEAERISYKLNFSGSAILVTKADLNRARLASKDHLGAAGQSAKDDPTNDIWSDPSLTHVRLLRQQETRLARSIGQLKAVKAATVHISKPEASPFIRDAERTTASVVIELRPGAFFSSRDTAAVVSLISHSVEGLVPGDVSVMDTEGRLLTSEGGLEGDVAGQLEFRRRLETGLAAKAETMLAEVLGLGRAVVRVTADVDFTQTTSTQKTYDPSGKVKSTEKIVSEQNSSTRGSATGVAGTSSNVGSGANSRTESPTSSKREESETNYLNPETTNTTAEAPGRIRRITVAAVVDVTDPDAAAADPAAKGQAKPPAGRLDKTAVEALIKQAVGFDTDRNDQIEVVLAKLAAAVPMEAAIPVTSMDSLKDWLKAASLGIVALVVGALGMFALRRMRPVEIKQPTTTELSLNAAKRLATLSERARENPEAVAEVLKAWLGAAPAASTGKSAAANGGRQTIPLRQERRAA